MITNYSYPSFKSKLPPALPKSKNTTFDFWPEFKNLCKKEGKEKELHKLLDRLERNGDNNILALDYKPKNKYDITNYYFLLYKDTENLMIDRNSKDQGQRLFSSRPIAGHEWIQNEKGTIHDMQQRTDFRSLTDALLYTLDRILTKGSKENKNIFIENQHKIKLDKGTIKSLE